MDNSIDLNLAKNVIRNAMSVRPPTFDVPCANSDCDQKLVLERDEISGIRVIRNLWHEILLSGYQNGIEDTRCANYGVVCDSCHDKYLQNLLEVNSEGKIVNAVMKKYRVRVPGTAIMHVEAFNEAEAKTVAYEGASNLSAREFVPRWAEIDACWIISQEF